MIINPNVRIDVYYKLKIKKVDVELSDTLSSLIYIQTRRFLDKKYVLKIDNNEKYIGEKDLNTVLFKLENANKKIKNIKINESLKTNYQIIKTDICY